MDEGEIIGITIGSVLGVIILIAVAVIVYCCCGEGGVKCGHSSPATPPSGLEHEVGKENATSAVVYRCSDNFGYQNEKIIPNEVVGDGRDGNHVVIDIPADREKQAVDIGEDSRVSIEVEDTRHSHPPRNQLKDDVQLRRLSNVEPEDDSDSGDDVGQSDGDEYSGRHILIHFLDTLKGKFRYCLSSRFIEKHVVLTRDMPADGNRHIFATRKAKSLYRNPPRRYSLIVVDNINEFRNSLAGEADKKKPARRVPFTTGCTFKVVNFELNDYDTIYGGSMYSLDQEGRARLRLICDPDGVVNHRSLKFCQ